MPDLCRSPDINAELPKIGGLMINTAAGGGGGAKQGGSGPGDGSQVAVQSDLHHRQRCRGRGETASLVVSSI